MAAAIRTALSIRTEANDAWSRIGSGSAIEWWPAISGVSSKHRHRFVAAVF
jgi:hypothetical protein